MTWYRTGTVTVTNGSANVTLAGGDALQNIFPDDGFVGPDGRTYAVNTIGGAGAFTLQTPYQGVNAAGAAYLIIPTADYVQLRDLLEATNTLITAYQAIALAAGVGRFAPGVAASPGVRGVGHEGTGLVWNDDETLSISIAGTIVATFGANSLNFLRGTDGDSFVTGKTGGQILRIFANNDTIGLFNVAGAAAGRDGIRITDGAVSFDINAAQMGAFTGAGLQVAAGGEFQSTIRIQPPGSIGGITMNGGSASLTGYMGFNNSDGTRKGYVGFDSKAGPWSFNIETGANFDFNSTVRVNGSTGNGFQIGIIADAQRGGQIVANGSAGTGNLLINTTSSGYSLRFGIDGGVRMELDTNGKLNLLGAAVGGGANQQLLRLMSLSDASNNSIEMLFQAIISGGTKTAIQGQREGSSLHTNLKFITNDAARLQIDSSGNTLPGADNAQIFGWPSVRWSVIYAATGTINTSDEREKKWRGAPTKAELRAAARIIGELGFFQWEDAVATKGDDARYHFGPRAQRVWAIMADEKLVAPIGKAGRPGKTPYAFLCYDEWDETVEQVYEDKTIKAVYSGRGKNRKCVEPERIESVDTGETRVLIKAGNRYGVRTDQLTMFMIAAQQFMIEENDRRLTALEERLKQ